MIRRSNKDTFRGRHLSIIGLGFGDCGKGHFTDYFCRRLNAGTVVRFNGGAQAGHNVVLSGGTHHTFSQFGSGTFIPSVHTVLALPVVVHPSALRVEGQVLISKGVDNPFARLLVDPRCRITTPFHQASGRLREIARGDAPHGSCGCGVGETVKHGLEHPEEIVFWKDLHSGKTIRDKLEAVRLRMLSGWKDVPFSGDPRAKSELDILRGGDIAERWLDFIAPALAGIPLCDIDDITRRLSAGRAIFEGAQGILLDEWKGFHPHTSWSSTGTDAVESVAAGYGVKDGVDHCGVIRAYMTRHGQGPFPTHDPAFADIPEPHNTGEGWQGDFRRGHADGVLLRYAVESAGKLDGILISHLDCFDRGHSVNWCARYATADGKTLAQLETPSGNDLVHQEELRRTLEGACPVYEEEPLTSDGQLIDKISSCAGIPPLYGSYGPCEADIRELRVR